MTLSFTTPDGTFTTDPQRVVVAGWTGRDEGAVRHHIEELEAIGVAPPSTFPLAYKVTPDRLTQEDAIVCVGSETSGEVEPVVVFAGGRRWLTLGSDHTDRALETHSVALSKQICPKVLAREAWPFEAVADHLDTLRLSSAIADGGGEFVPYQEGALAAIKPLGEVIALSGLGDDDEAVLFCGTVPAIGAVRPAQAIRMALEDPASGRSIALAYTTTVLPVVA